MASPRLRIGVAIRPGEGGGESGYSGISGYSGEAGEPGTSGYSGYSGAKGEPGEGGGGSGQLNVVEVKTENYLIQIEDSLKTIIANSNSNITFTLPSVSSSNIGIEYTLGKVGTGNLIVKASDNDTIEDSGPGETIYCKDDTFAMITLKLITETQWVLKNGGNGTWITTY